MSDIKRELENKYAAIKARMYGRQQPVVNMMAVKAAQEAMWKRIGDLDGPVQVGGVAGPTGLATPSDHPIEDGATNYTLMLKWVASRHGLDPDMIQSAVRKRKVIAARHELWWRVRYQLGYSFPRIARLAHRDHTSVYHGVQSHAAKLVDATGPSLP